MKELLGFDNVFVAVDFARLSVRLAFDFIFVFAVVHGVYRRKHPNQEYVFTYYLLNLITFSLCFLLAKVPMQLGFALGLFAVFGILRYRTEPIRIRELTYLFVVIGLGILNAVANASVSVAELLVVNGVIVGMVAVLELSKMSNSDRSHSVLYDNLDLLRGDEEQLREDLSNRTGLEVTRVKVDRFDLLRDVAELTVYYSGRRPSAAGERTGSGRHSDRLVPRRSGAQPLAAAEHFHQAPDGAVSLKGMAQGNVELHDVAVAAAVPLFDEHSCLLEFPQDALDRPLGDPYV